MEYVVLTEVDGVVVENNLSVVLVGSSFVVVLVNFDVVPVVVIGFLEIVVGRFEVVAAGVKVS